MQRRALLKYLAWLLVSSQWSKAYAFESANRITKNKKIIIVGAGLAGLSAAAALHRQGYQVQMLEARERIGGRLCTSRQWPDFPVDLGASWIHGRDGNPLTTLADQAKAKRLTTSYAKVVTYQSSGKPLNVNEQSQLEAMQQQIQHALEQAQELPTDLSIEQALQPVFSKMPQQLQPMLNFILSSEMEQEYAGAVSMMSAQQFDSAHEFSGDDVFFPAGFDQLASYLAQNVPILLQQQVHQINWTSQGVQVNTNKQRFSADAVIVTLPLGVLKREQTLFNPALPQDKQQAIAALGMGVLNKCYLRFPRVFWPKDADWLEYVSPEHGHWTEWLSLTRTTGQPVLLGFNAATRGLAIESLSDAAIIDSAMQTLTTLFGTHIPNPDSYQITRWGSDPYAYGSYSFQAVGCNQQTRQKLQYPLDNRLFFAGEACEPKYFGTAHGAYLSGLQAAADVLVSLER